ncbi:YcxB family protein [Bradyrhizobium sp. OK095]|uniref:YcxB family protein n=1 Tax=Bradyrhizobium sp. OK095 TaxID=1882760 RepID=UPI001FCDD39C|nr:YcxB family protein [Bradyrhizobium sp. OK095]
MIAISFDGHWPPRKVSVLIGLLIATAIIASFVALPQIMFKPEERTLTVCEDGIATSIGKKSASVKWKEIAAIQDLPEIAAMMGKNGKAFLIPRRAFNSENEKSDFLTAVRTWQAAKTG